MNITEQETLMYSVMGLLSERGVPMVFKGGLVTKAVLDENGLEQIARQTKDIDANWVGKDKSIEIIANVINKVLDDIDPLLHVEIDREPSDISSGRISIVDQRNDLIFRMDIDVAHPPTQIVRLNINDVVIDCVDAKQILADKISVISSQQIFRRSKDLLDAYALSSCTGFIVSDIKNIINKTGHRLGKFTAFKEGKDDIRHAYEKLMGMEQKPAFEVVYDRVSKIIRPFEFEKVERQDFEWNPIEGDYIKLEAVK